MPIAKIVGELTSNLVLRILYTLYSKFSQIFQPTKMRLFIVAVFVKTILGPIRKIEEIFLKED